MENGILLTCTLVKKLVPTSTGSCVHHNTFHAKSTQLRAPNESLTITYQATPNDPRDYDPSHHTIIAMVPEIITPPTTPTTSQRL